MIKQDPQGITNQLDTTPPNFHTHNGADAPKIKVRYLEGILPVILQTISVVDATTAPTNAPQEGTVIVQYDATHWRVWIYVHSLWKSLTLA